MCNTKYKLYQLDKTGYQGHQFGVMNALHERPLAHKNGIFDKQAVSNFKVEHATRNPQPVTRDHHPFFVDFWMMCV